MLNFSNTVYLSGPISGNIENNKQAFNDTEKELKERYRCRILNPAKLPEDWTYKEYMFHDLCMLFVADTIIMLPGWEDSPGATAELSIAEALKLNVIFQEQLEWLLR